MRVQSTVYIFLMLLFPFQGIAGPQDAYVHFNLGLAREHGGDLDNAYKLYKKACMAPDGHGKACLKWGILAEKKGNQKDRKRALSSAVMLEPENGEARYYLAKYLLEKRDYTWAIEHLAAALEASKKEYNRGLIGYYLGYAHYKNGELETAEKILRAAMPKVPSELTQRCTFYLALSSLNQGKRKQGVSLLETVARGPEGKWAEAARKRIASISSFPRRHWYSGMVMASLGFNTHPSSAFLDDPGTETSPVLQSVFRGDVLLGAGNHTNGFESSITFYREQNWTEIGGGNSGESTGIKTNTFSPRDLNTTLFLGQVGYARRAWLSGMEHEFRIGAESQVQILDHVPETTNDPENPIRPSGDSFQVYAWTYAFKLWWTVAENENSEYSGRIKFENWSNQEEQVRTALRMRLRLTHSRYFLDRKLRLNALVGFRYDRTYEDPYVIKYDRLLPELEVKLKWRTPVPRLTAVVGAGVKYNWYLNARQNEANSFRPSPISPDSTAPKLTEAELALYYDLTRHDVEWEINGEIQAALWKKAAAAITYVHHQRISNLDRAWRQQGIRATDYGYARDVVMLELRQGF